MREGWWRFGSGWRDGWLVSCTFCRLVASSFRVDWFQFSGKLGAFRPHPNPSPHAGEGFESLAGAIERSETHRRNDETTITRRWVHCCRAEGACEMGQARNSP